MRCRPNVYSGRSCQNHQFMEPPPRICELLALMFRLGDLAPAFAVLLLVTD